MDTRMDINRLMVEMRSLKSQSQSFAKPESLAARDVVGNGLGQGLNIAAPAKDVPSFGQVLEQAVDKVNGIQKNSAALSKAYEQGDPNVDISDVMVASQKAGVAFQATLQVRNKLVDAYRDVMNMPI